MNRDIIIKSILYMYILAKGFEVHIIYSSIAHLYSIVLHIYLICILSSIAGNLYPIIIPSDRHIIIPSYSSSYHHITSENHLGYIQNTFGSYLGQTWEPFGSPWQGRTRIGWKCRDINISSWKL